MNWLVISQMTEFKSRYIFNNLASSSGIIVISIAEINLVSISADSLPFGVSLKWQEPQVLILRIERE